jgi:hypothetical protein
LAVGGRSPTYVGGEKGAKGQSYCTRNLAERSPCGRMKVFGGVKVTMKALLFLSLAAALFVNNGVNGFIGIHRNSYRKSVSVNNVVRSNVDYISLSSTSPSGGSNRKCAKMISHSNKQSISVKRSLNAFISFFLAIGMVPSAFAVSGGGLDYANLG